MPLALVPTWYTFAVFLLQLVPFVCSLLIRPTTHPRSTEGHILDRILDGSRFIFARKVVLGALSLDLFAVLLGGAVALMPIYAKDILKLGPQGLGLLRCAPAIGAASMAIFLASRPILSRAGAKMLTAVACFGVATCVFALSTHLVLSLIALVCLGAADMVSVVVRQSLIQLRTPAHMRGRVSSVSQIFIGASNELGEFESGMTAHYFGVVPAALMGGVGTILIVLTWKKLFPELAQADRLDELITQ